MLHILAVRAYGDLHQPARREIQALIHIHGAGNAIGAEDGHFLQHVRAVLLDEAAGGGLDDAVEDTVGLLAGHDAGGLIVHAQQQGHDLTHAAAVQGGHLRGHGRGTEGVGAARHGHGRRGAGAGRDCRDAACRAAGIDPDSL